MDTVTDTTRLAEMIDRHDINPFGPATYFTASKIFRQLAAVADPMELPEAVRTAMAVFSISHHTDGHGDIGSVFVPAQELIEAVRDSI